MEIFDWNLLEFHGQGVCLVGLVFCFLCGLRAAAAANAPQREQTSKDKQTNHFIN